MKVSKEEEKDVKKPLHRESTDIEDLAISCDLSNLSQLSDLSETSGIYFEEELF